MSALLASRNIRRNEDHRPRTMSRGDRLPGQPARMNQGPSRRGISRCKRLIPAATRLSEIVPLVGQWELRVAIVLRVNGSGDPNEMRFVGVSLDCSDPAELADFYLQLLGGRVLWSRPTSVGVQVPGLLLILQRVADYRPPTWPGASIVHLDLTAGEHLDEPVQRAVALGAQLADPQSDDRWRVLLDLAGHPFCITTLAPSPKLLES